MSESADRPNLPTYTSYAGDHFVTGKVLDINEFTYTVRYQPNGALTNPSLTDDLLAACVEGLGSVLTSTGIHYFHELKVKPQRLNDDSTRLDPDRSIVEVSLNHDRFHFQLVLYDDRLTIRRQSSSFKNFYEWYRRIMTEALALEATIRRALERRSDTRMTLISTQYEFKIIFSDFVYTGQGLTDPFPRNVNVLEEMLRSVPNAGGSSDLSKQDFYRVDLTLSRLEEFMVNDRRIERNCWYMLEAPFNERGRYLVLTAQMRNASHELLHELDETGEPVVAPMDSELADDYYIALYSFLKCRALETFMAKLFGHWNFKTQREL